jgi:hypothetical protein
MYNAPSHHVSGSKAPSTVIQMPRGSTRVSVPKAQKWSDGVCKRQLNRGIPVMADRRLVIIFCTFLGCLVVPSSSWSWFPGRRLLPRWSLSLSVVFSAWPLRMGLFGLHVLLIALLVALVSVATVGRLGRLLFVVFSVFSSFLPARIVLLVSVLCSCLVVALGVLWPCLR